MALKKLTTVSFWNWLDMKQDHKTCSENFLAFFCFACIPLRQKEYTLKQGQVGPIPDRAKSTF